MPAFICRTRGVQYAPSPQPPERRPICEDERQYVGWNGRVVAVDGGDAIVRSAERNMR